MRLDHLLSMEIWLSEFNCLVLKDQLIKFNRFINIFGDDAFRGHTRSHSEHDG